MIFLELFLTFLRRLRDAAYDTRRSDGARLDEPK